MIQQYKSGVTNRGVRDHFFQFETETETWETQSQGWDWDWDLWHLVSKVETETETFTFGLKSWDWDWDFYLWSQILRLRLRLLPLVSNFETETFHSGLKYWDWNWDFTPVFSLLWNLCSIVLIYWTFLSRSFMNEPIKKFSRKLNILLWQICIYQRQI